MSFSHYPAWPPPVAVSLVTLSEHPCPYRPGRAAQSRGFLARRLSPSLYHSFMDAGFRRSGRLLYQPVCRGCRACVPIRVPVAGFRPSKSQRRCWRRNADLVVEAARPAPSDEKFDLYRRYIRQWHGGGQDDSREEFEAFLYDSPVDTLEFTYRQPDGRLLAVGICDISASSLSSVYFYFSPADASRGLGTYGALREIAHTARIRIPYYYLGYWVYGCASMEYKSQYRPFELLGTDGRWRAGVAETGAAADLDNRRYMLQ